MHQWVFDPEAEEAYEYDIVAYRNGEHCLGCNEAGEEAIDAEYLANCKSGFCDGVFCETCRDNDFEDMRDDWLEHVMEGATWLKGLEKQTEAEGSEEYNHEYLAMNLREAVRYEETLKPAGWCMTCFLECTRCKAAKCGKRAVKGGICRVCGVVEKKRKREYRVSKCEVTERAGKRMRIVIDLTVESDAE
jgi:hypothetical protein